MSAAVFAEAEVRVAELRVGGEAETWRDLGFSVSADATVQVGGVRLALDPDERGLVEWTLAGDGRGEEGIDGLPTVWTEPREPGDPAVARSSGQAMGAGHPPVGSERGGARGRRPAIEPPIHPNGGLAIDHVVVFTPSLDRTTAALAAVGVERRRVRDAGSGMRQGFFRLGEVILELVESSQAPLPFPRTGEPAPARFWGLVVTVADLEVAAALLGEHAGPIKDAVQPGRRIATVRPLATGGLPLALLTPDPRRSV